MRLCLSEMMERFRKTMMTVDIYGSEMSARYQDAVIDLFRWQTVNATNGKSFLRKYYPFIPKVTFAETISDYLFPTEIDLKILFPLKEISIFGVYAKIPKKTFAYLRMRYPLTWFMDFPYKWKCWTAM